MSKPTWMFALRARVAWANAPARTVPYGIVARRYVEDTATTYRQYCLYNLNRPDHVTGMWVFEEELLPWEEIPV